MFIVDEIYVLNHVQDAYYVAWINLYSFQYLSYRNSIVMINETAFISGKAF